MTDWCGHPLLLPWNQIMVGADFECELCSIFLVGSFCVGDAMGDFITFRYTFVHVKGVQRWRFMAKQWSATIFKQSAVPPRGCEDRKLTESV